MGTHWKPLNTSKKLENPNQAAGCGGGEGGGGGGGGEGLGTHWKPLNTSKRRENPNQSRAARSGQWQRPERRRVAGAVGVDKAVGAVRGEGVWAHIGSLQILAKDWKTE